MANFVSSLGTLAVGSLGSVPMTSISFFFGATQYSHGLDDHLAAVMAIAQRDAGGALSELDLDRPEEAVRATLTVKVQLPSDNLPLPSRP